jgi:ribosomal protein RSM22 (predicted rRNA methylase)
LVVSAFTLTDLASDVIRKKTIESLWNQTKDVLVLVDRGTPYGSYIIRRARAQILNMAEKQAQDVHVVAPVGYFLLYLA